MEGFKNYYLLFASFAFQWELTFHLDEVRNQFSLVSILSSLLNYKTANTVGQAVLALMTALQLLSIPSAVLETTDLRLCGLLTSLGLPSLFEHDEGGFR